MSLRILVDEDMQSKALVALLRKAGHDVKTVAEAGLSAADDGSVLAKACEDDRVLLTRNAVDFRDLHDADPTHPGIIAFFQDADRAKQMSYSMIVAAISNIEFSGVPLRAAFLVLNAWNY